MPKKTQPKNLIYEYKQNLALNNSQELIYLKTQLNQSDQTWTLQGNLSKRKKEIYQALLKTILYQDDTI